MAQGQKDSDKFWVRSAPGMMIPFILLIVPAVGAGLGSLADQHFGTGRAGAAIGLILGLTAAVIRIRRILKEMS